METTKMKFLTTISLILCPLISITRSEPTCIIQGVCGSNENGVVPCTVSKDPHKFEDSSNVLAILKDECPELFTKGSNEIPDVCCSPEDVMLMQGLMERVSQATSICPSCARNIKEFLCHFHCAPNQASFIEIKKTSPSVNGSAIEEMLYYVKKNSIDRLYKSCSLIPMTKQIVRMGGCEKDCDNGAEYARVFGMRKTMSPFDLKFKLVDMNEKVTVNGKPGAPVDLLITDCAESKSCSDTCPSA
jgi:hypothetical protein